MTRERCRGATIAALLVALIAAGTSRAGAQDSPAADSLRRVARAWPVMGTMLTITVWGSDSVAMLGAVHDARDSVRLVDSLMSTWRAESEISRVNAAAGGAAVRVSPQTMRVLVQARRWWQLSRGAFDPTVGPLVRAWGFHGTRGRIPPRRELDSLRALVGYGEVALDTTVLTVRLPRAGMQLDLGGIAKGFALDLARAALQGATISGGTVDLGGNVLAFGRPPGDGRWQVAVVDPRRRDRALGVLAIDSGAVATSGDYERYYVIRGRRYAHIIDPRTGRPARGVLSATAIGPRGEWSDGLSATLFLLGPDRGMALADSLPGVAAIWVRDAGTGVVRARDVVRSARARDPRAFEFIQASTPSPATSSAPPCRRKAASARAESRGR